MDNCRWIFVGTVGVLVLLSTAFLCINDRNELRPSQGIPLDAILQELANYDQNEPFLIPDMSPSALQNGLKATFMSWAKANRKLYATVEEHEKRFKIFLDSWKRVFEHNKDSGKSFTLGLTGFADMTDEEFLAATATKQKLKECWTAEDRQRMASGLLAEELGSESIIPRSRDWRDEGIVSPVKNQGRCGSCWAFSAVGALEAHYKKKHGNNVLLSEQQLLDCSYGYGDFGCEGGFPARAFEYLRRSGGLDKQEDYPYEMASNGSAACRFNKKKAVVKVERVVNITESDEQELEYAVAYAGPVTVAIRAVGDFRLYNNGVYTTASCGAPKPVDLTHAVLAVGYGVDYNGMKYWIIKNSWGDNWGLKGYMLFERGRNLCGISDCASYAVVA